VFYKCCIIIIILIIIIKQRLCVTQAGIKAEQMLHLLALEEGCGTQELFDKEKEAEEKHLTFSLSGQVIQTAEMCNLI
jgi:hypothetical protein